MKHLKPSKKGGLAAVVLVIAAAWAPHAHAQLAVSDAPVETFTGDMDQNELPQLIQQETTAALSLTTGGATDLYQPDAGTIASLDQGLFPGAGINIGNFNQLFVGYESCAPDCTDEQNTIANAVLATYQAAMTVASQQVQELDGEGDPAGAYLTDAMGSTNTLRVLQDIAGILAVGVEEQQYQRQLAIADLQERTTRDAQQLNLQMQQWATSAGAPNPLLSGLPFF